MAGGIPGPWVSREWSLTAKPDLQHTDGKTQ
jgi:hypothetical protein